MSLQGSQREELEKQLAGFVGVPIGPPEVGRDLVNEAMIRQWCDAMGDRNPVYSDADVASESVHGGVVAPPTMLQAWILPGLEMALGDDDPQDKQKQLHGLLSEAGYTGVVATDCEQEYVRYLRPGDQVSAVTVIEDISEQKATALGIGYFINTRTTFRGSDGDELGWMTFRVLKYQPAEQPAAAQQASEGAAPAVAAPRRLRPAQGHDNAWWWQGLDRGEILIQKCAACQELRHPPRPMCPQCRSTDWDFVASTGSGTIYSYVVIHHPEVPGYEYPLVVAVVDLEEGTRLVANVAGCDWRSVEIGMPVQGFVEAVDDDLKLPMFRPAGSQAPASAGAGA
jgi:uncharacterized OB-fold protein/acyl dehydratase